ncbi:hypothetical protein [Caulobacter sp. RHG1]|uniref:hypothetical protein n=1 Tax=Caulobacter sp. (strain RHG1) TaxID=2545762 RepID=UPI0015542589|nr:hypothetical protein [Caulobacter sp. RHG1]NQE60524.1 hypothetical protein [Caulobacter sp. RHG1]
MRATVPAIAAAGLMLAGCAVAPSLPWSKSAAMPTRPACPAMKNEAWGPVVDGAIHKTFDQDLQKRFGDTATHVRIAWSKTDKGDTVITAQRIGPAKYAMPEVGKGGEVEVVFKACTGKPLKTRKLANLEKTPKPLATEN